MKKLAFLVASVVVCASASVFADNNVQGDNVFGVMAVASGTEYTLVAVPWCECSTTDDQPVVVSNIVKTANLEEGDMAYVVGAAGKFNAWELKLRDDVLYWDSVETVTLEGLGSLASDVATAARGSAIILRRKTPKDGSGNAKKFYLFGQVGTSSDVAITLPAGRSLIAPPYYAEGGINILNDSHVLNNSKLTITNLSDGDKIVVRTSLNGASREYTYKSSDSKWYYNDPANGFTPTEASSITIPCGLGAWYEAKASVTATWKSVPKKSE